LKKKEITIKACAKVNLSLDVVKKLENGYHALQTVMGAVDLADTVTVSASGAAGIYGGHKITLSLATPTNTPVVPISEPGLFGKENLAYRAAETMYERFCPQSGNKIAIALTKQIPIAAGLAGGSTDAAAVILALAHLWRLDIDLPGLIKIGTRLGADIPFCLAANAFVNTELRFAEDPLASPSALAEGVGEILTPLSSLEGSLILVKPRIPVSTARIYSLLAGYGAIGTGAIDTKGLVEAIRISDRSAASAKMKNVMQPVTAKEYPIVAETIEKLTTILPEAKVIMSGSGPTILAYFAEFNGASENLTKTKAAFPDTEYEVYTTFLI
jgi:4-diphosphocytidyl-2-C-methyl-D-erythritol kinase